MARPKLFRLLVTGSRDWPEADAWVVHTHLDWAFATALDCGLELVIVHGACKSGRYRGGVDRYADEWCTEVGVDPDPYPADWNTFGRSAGFRRNDEMVASEPKIDLCAAFIRAESRGATHCYSAAKAAGIPAHLVRYEALKQ